MENDLKQCWLRWKIASSGNASHKCWIDHNSELIRFLSVNCCHSTSAEQISHNFKINILQHSAVLYTMYLLLLVNVCRACIKQFIKIKCDTLTSKQLVQHNRHSIYTWWWIIPHFFIIFLKIEEKNLKYRISRINFDKTRSIVENH